MSGARALASARRRRASPDELRRNVPTPTPGPVSIPQPSSSSLGGSMGSSLPPQPPSQKMTPANMLLNHNKIIDNLQQVVESLNHNMESQIEETKALQSSVKSMHMDDGNIAFFKKKVSNMEKEMLDIKKHILKVQTFAMETNLQCLELKKKVLIASESTNEEQLEASGHIAEILTNTETNPGTEMETNEIVVE